jgi:carboxyl-terminal processing protease
MAIQTASAMPLTQKDRIQIINRIKQLITHRHINVSNPNQDYQPWVALADERSASLVRVAHDEEFERGIGELLNALGSSHTAFFHRRQDKVPAPYSINATLRAVDARDGNRWMFLDVIEDGAAFRAGIKPGEFLLGIDSKPLVPPERARFRIGARHQLDIGNFDRAVRQVFIEIPDKTAKDRPPMIEPRSLSHRMLAADIGLVKVATFPGTVGQKFAGDLDLAIHDLKTNGMRRLIVDIRGNVGGGLGSLRLMSYLCPDKLEIGYSLTRRRLRNGYQKEKLIRIERIPARKPELFMMAIRFGLIHRDRSMVLVTEGLDAQPFHGRIVILVNEYTHSAAEMVASFAKENHLATLVGTRTAGEVLGGANFKLRNGYRLRMPVAGWYTWHGDCIEGKGVEPDIVVENSPPSLAAGIDVQLEKATEVLQMV